MCYFSVEFVLYVQARCDVAILLLLVIFGKSITQLSAADDTRVRNERQVENEWASTSKRDHKVSENIKTFMIISIFHSSNKIHFLVNNLCVNVFEYTS